MRAVPLAAAAENHGVAVQADEFENRFCNQVFT
jgi:hypothetical protein